MYVCEDNIQTTVDNKAATTTTSTTHKHVYKKPATAVTFILL